MSATNYEKQILDTIQKLVDNAVQNASYDKTIQCTILKVQDAAMGKYKVKYQDSAFYAYSTTTDVTYAAGKSVYVLVPGNDMASNKTIIGTVDSLGADYINNISIENRYDIIGNNIASSEDIFGLCSYKSGGDSIVLYDSNNDINLINYNAEAADLYIKKGTALLLGAYFKTDLPTEQKFRGNYGISFETIYADEAGEPVERNFIIDIDNMNGNPYNLVNFTKQISAYELDGLKFQSINKIQIFSDNFPHTATGKEDDIFVKDIQIYSAEAIPEEELTNCGLSLITPQGIYFDNQSAATAVREIQAQVRVKGKAASDDFSNLSFYWFKENVGITINSEKYNKLGGSGWECLNEYNVIDRTDPDHLLIEWNAAGSSISVMKRENAAKENRYKCVAVYNTDTILEKEITIYNLSSSYDITIASSNGTQFYFDVGTTNLSCLINGTLQTDSEYTYSWGAVDFYGSFKNLEETSNTYENVAVNEIINYTVYKCSVWYDGDYIGTNSIILYNSLEKAQNYNLVINNGVQVYKYDTNGIAPNNKSLDNPITLLPLTFTLFDDMGQEIPTSGIPGSAIKWKVPIEDTMIIIPNEYGTPTIEDGYYIYTNIYSLGYDIATKYNINASENNIELNIDYEGVSYKAVTNLSFIKEGESGTNGTDFICKIVPNIATGELNDYPMVTYNEDTSNYSLNYTPTSQNLWFKVQLWHDGIKIFENVVSGNSNVEQDEEGNFKEVDVSWSILKNKYTKNQSLNIITEDSNLSINAATGVVTFDATEYADPANIVKCTVTYDGMTYYDTMPVIVSRIENSNYTLKLKKNSGFRYAIYSTDGRYPQYDNNQPFEIVTLNQDTDISESTTYIWEVYGSSYINGWQDEVNIIPRKTYGQILKANQKYYKPVDEFNGLSVNNGISVTTAIGSIQIPIHLYLNKYSNALMNDWDGNSIQIKEDEGLILSPQVGAGKKEQDNSFTGVFLGSIEESGEEVETGLFGYSSGERTIALDASDGSARFGKTGSGQIVIDPSTNQAILTSGNYDTTEGTGMQINLSEPSITWGNGNFSIDSTGKVVATQLHMTADSDRTVQQEITSLDNATSILQINPITNNLIIPCDINHKPFETKQYTIQCYPKFKNIDVSGVTCSFNPSSITNLSYYWSVANKNIVVTVNSAKAIQETTNLITATFTYKDSNNVTWTQVQQFNISLGLQGTQGIQGEPGPDGESSYFHYYYSDVINPSGFSQMTKTPSEFMGTYVDTTAEDSTNPNDYIWFKLEGTDGEAGLDGFSIWIASTAPSSSNTYLRSQLSGPSASQTPKVGEIVVSENRYQYTITRVENNKIFVGSSTEESILLNRSGSSDTSSPIIRTVDYSGLVNGDLLRIDLEMGYARQSSWHSSYGSADLVWTGETQTVTVTMPNYNNSCTCVLNPSTSQISCSFSTHAFDGGYITLTKAITKVDLKGEKGDDGAAGAPAYTVVLSNESHTFPATDSAAVASSTTTEVLAYKGTSSMTPTIGTITGQVTGLTTSVSGTTITITAATTLTTENGILTIPITVDGKSFTKKFSWSLAKAGEKGEDGEDGTSPTAYSLIVSHAAVVKTTSGTYNPTAITLTAKSQTGNAAITNFTTGRYAIFLNGSSTAAATPASTANYSYTIPANTTSIRIALYNSSTGTTILDEQTVSIVSDGTNGRGISSITNYYLATSASSGVTRSTSGWTTAIQTMTAINQYLWNYEDIYYTNNTHTYTNPAIIGRYGQDGAAGKGIVSIVEYYAVNNSTTAPEDSEFSTTVKSPSSTNKYLWNYEKITYENPSSVVNTDKRIIGTYGRDGTNGTSPYISYLTNEAQTFAAGTAKTIKTSLYAYQGITEKDVQIKSVNGVTASTSSTATGKTGMNFYVNSTSSVAHPEITFSATADLPQTQTEQLKIKYIISGENTERSVYFSYSSTTTGSSGAAASLVDITASSQMFKSTDGGTTFSPDTIVLTPRFQTVTYSKWQYIIGANTPVDVVSGQNGLTLNGSVLTISKDSSLFDTNSSVTFKCISSNVNIFDTITVVKLYDISNIQIGGRNYLAYTGVSKDIFVDKSSGYITNDPYSIVSGKNLADLGFSIGDEVTISLDWEISQNGTLDFIYGDCRLEWVKDSTYITFIKIPIITFSADKTSGKVIVTTKLSTEAILTSNKIRFRIDNSVLVLKISNMKLEKGNKSTDWTPAPEDVDNNIADSNQTILNQVITNIEHYYFVTKDSLRPTAVKEDQWSLDYPATAMEDEVSYVWQRDKSIFGDKTAIWSEPYSIKNKIGYTTEYAQSNDPINAPEENSTLWGEAKPENVNKYVWTRTRTDWDTGLSTYSTPLCDTLTKKLQDSLQQMGANVSELSEKGFVKLYRNYIYLVDREDMEDESDGGVKGIQMGKEGIVYFSGATGWNQDPTKENNFSHYEVCSSVWDLGGTMNLQALMVENITASEIKDGTLKLGEENTEGRLEVYKLNGKKGSEVLLANGDGLRVRLIDSQTQNVVGFITLSDTKGFILSLGPDKDHQTFVWGSDTNEKDENNKDIINLDTFKMTKAKVTSELNFDSKIIVQPASFYGHQGLAFVRGGN